MRIPLSLAALAACSLALPAQVPDGWAAGAAFRQIGYTTGGGGVTVFHPHGSGRWAVQDLPVDLTGIGVQTTQVHGSNCIAIHPTDGRLFVGEVTLVPSDTLEIHEFRVAGRRAVGRKRHRIGLRDPSWIGMAIEQMDWLPDGRLLFTFVGVRDAYLQGTNLAILDPGTGIVLPVPVTGVSPVGFWDAMTLDAAGTTAYFAVNQRFAPRSTKIYSVPVPSGGAAKLVAQRVDNTCPGLSLDTNGDLLASLARRPDRGLFRIANGTWTQLTPASANLRGTTFVDPVTGDFLGRVDRSDALGRAYQEIERIDRNGNRTVVQTYPFGSLVIVDFAIMPPLTTYGRASTNAYRWRVAPNPGGAPLLGSSTFAIHATATTRPIPGWFVLGLQPASQPLLGTTLRVDQILCVCPIAPAVNVSAPLPIPNTASLAGARLHAQMFHVDGSTLVASSGLRVTVF